MKDIFCAWLFWVAVLFLAVCGFVFLTSFLLWDLRPFNLILNHGWTVIRCIMILVIIGLAADSEI